MKLIIWIKIIKKSKEENVSNEELKNNIKKLTDELEKNKNLVFKNEFNQKHKDILINMYIEELSHKIEESDKEKDKIKQNENKLSEEIVNLKTKIDSLNDTIKEKDILVSNLQTQINENKDKSSIDEKMIPPAKTKFIVETKWLKLFFIFKIFFSIYIDEMFSNIFDILLFLVFLV